jgi:phosphatidylinositol alpha-mannosyltransferase
VEVQFEGRVADESLPSYYQAADVVCSPALGGESFGIVLVEAMAAGRPIVATKIAGYEELVSNSGSARLVAIDDVEALAYDVISVLQNPVEARALGARGASFAVRYDWPSIARRLEAIYLGVAGTRTVRAFQQTAAL